MMNEKEEASMIDSEVVTEVEDVALVERRRAQIVAAATKLFSKKGFYRTTIKEIAKQAGISPGLVYLYVREKEDILLLVLLQVVEGYVKEIPKAIEGIEDPMLRLMKTVDAYCRVVDRLSAATVLAYRSTKSLSVNRRQIIQNRELETNAIVADVIDGCMEAGLIRPLNVDVLIYQLVLIAHGWALKSWYLRSRVSLDDYIAASLENLLTGVLSDKGNGTFEATLQRLKNNTDTGG
ncbi:MAG: TetR/AcrR family transcriptional regulator [Rhodobacteraceae bacterium]|nr:TetR/AcrR family transcriptional regulator [Paracoccaceae bacterium]